MTSRISKLALISKLAFGLMFLVVMGVCSTLYALDSSTMLLGSSVKEGTGIATINFDIDAGVTWPNDGTLVVAFPSAAPTGAFDLTGVGVTDAFSPDSSVDGGFTVGVSGSTVTITRTGGATALTTGNYKIALANVTNPGTIGTTGTFTITLTDSTPTNLDTDTMPGVVISDAIDLGSGSSGSSSSGVCLIDVSSQRSPMLMWALMGIALVSLIRFSKKEKIKPYQ